MENENYIKTQKNLIKKAETAYYHGLRHRGLSGTVCEYLLMKSLRNSIKDLKFDKGQIKYAEKDTVGHELVASRHMSGEQDIIIYTGEPLYKEAGCMVIHYRDVRGTIEVKKKISKIGTPKGLQDVFNKILISKENFPGKTEVKPFLVTYYYEDNRVPKNWFNAIKDREDISAFCFWGASHSKKFPWEMDDWKRFEKLEYANQYQELVKSILEIKNESGT